VQVSHETDVQRGKRAQEVLDNEVYAEAWAAIEAEIIAQWRGARNPADREQLHQLLLMHGKARNALESVMRTGLLAEAELSRKLSRAEQMMRSDFRYTA
jgi:hypothetical protein